MARDHSYRCGKCRAQVAAGVDHSCRAGGRGRSRSLVGSPGQPSECWIICRQCSEPFSNRKAIALEVLRLGRKFTVYVCGEPCKVALLKHEQPK